MVLARGLVPDFTPVDASTCESLNAFASPKACGSVEDAMSVSRYITVLRMLDCQKVARVASMVGSHSEVKLWCLPFEVPPTSWIKRGAGFAIGGMFGERDVGVVHFSADSGCYVFARSPAWLERHRSALTVRLPAGAASIAAMGAHGEKTGTDDLPLHVGKPPEAVSRAKDARKVERKWRKRANAQAVPAWKEGQDRRRSQLNGANGEVTGLDDMTRGGKKARKLGDKAQYVPAQCPHRVKLLTQTELRRGVARPQCPLCFELLDRVPAGGAQLFQHSSSDTITEAAQGAAAAAVTETAGAPSVPGPVAAQGAQAVGQVAVPPAAEPEEEPELAPRTEDRPYCAVVHDSNGRPVVFGPEPHPTMWRG
jgi:hypothetical protein